MQELNKKNTNYILKNNIFFGNNKFIQEIVKSINKDKFIIISGMIGFGKIDIIKEMLKITNTINSFFYFNKELDINNKINKYEDFMVLFQDFLSKNSDPKIIILENINNINGIKEFITWLNNKKKYKIIIIGNNIKISGINEIEIFPIEAKNIKNVNIDELLKYGKISEVMILNNNYFKEKFLDLTKNEIILKNILLDFSVKSLYLYNHTLTYLSKINNSLSIRQLHKDLNNQNIAISIPTIIDYINFSISAKIIKPCLTYDLKLNKEIKSKIKYYFTDNGIRNSLVFYELDKLTLLENLVFTELIIKGYKVYNGENGRYSFSFLGKKENQDIYISIFLQRDKKELKKEINKLLKVETKSENSKTINKFIIVENIEELKIKTIIYENLKIIELKDFLFEI